MNRKEDILAVISGTIIMMCLGTAYAWGIFLVPINDETGWGRTKISFAVSILLLTFSVFMSIGGFLEKKIGPSKTAFSGGLLVALGWSGASFAKDPLSLYVFYGILAGIGTGLCYMSSLSCGIKRFPGKKGLVSGIILFGFGFGTAFLSPLITKSVQKIGWRNSMLFFGSLFGLVILTASFFLKNPKNYFEKNAAESGNSFDFRQAIKTSAFGVMFLTYFAAMIPGMITIGHISAFIADKNFHLMKGALAITIISIFNGAGRVVGGYFSDIFGGKKILISLFLAMSFSMFMLSVSGDLRLIYALCALTGLSFGGFLSVYPWLTSDYFGKKDFSLIYGLLFIGYGLGCFTGPMLGGIIHDIAKDYSPAFIISGTLSLVSAFIALYLLKKPVNLST